VNNKAINEFIHAHTHSRLGKPHPGVVPLEAKDVAPAQALHNEPIDASGLRLKVSRVEPCPVEQVILKRHRPSHNILARINEWKESEMR
jgi:hypothetical protein